MPLELAAMVVIKFSSQKAFLIVGIISTSLFTWSKLSASVAVNAPKGIVFVLFLTVTNFDASPTIHKFASCYNRVRENRDKCSAYCVTFRNA